MSFLPWRNRVKIVISGLAYAGTTTIARIISSGKIPSLDEGYSATFNYQRSQKVIEDIPLSIFDLGGQWSFLDSFTEGLAEFIFSRVRTFIWVIDAGDPFAPRGKYYLDRSLEKLSQFSPDALIFIFQHKTDLIPEDQRIQVSNKIKRVLIKDLPLQYEFYETSILSKSIIGALEDVLSQTLDKKIHFGDYKD
jgi:hypothetical protein